MRTLGHDRHADVHVHLVADVAQLHLGCVVILRTLRVAAQPGAQVTLVWVVQIAEQCRPVTVVLQDLCKGFRAVIGEVVGQRVALLVVVSVSVV